MTLRGDLASVWRLATIGARRRWLVLIALAVVVSVVEAATGGVIYALVATLSGSGPTDLPVVGTIDARRGPMAVLVGAFFVARGVLVLAVVRLQHRTGHETGAAISTRLFDRYLMAPYEELVGRDVSARTKNVYQTVPEVVVYALIPAVVMVSEGLVALGLGVVVVIASPTVAALVAVYMGAVVAVVQVFVRSRLTGLGADSQERAEQSLKTLSEAFSGIREVRLLSLRPTMVARFAAQRRHFAVAHGSRASYVEVPRVVLESSTGLLVLLILVLSAATPGTLQEALPLLGLAGYAVSRVLPSMSRIAAARNNLRFGLPAVRLVANELDRDVVVDIPDRETDMPFTDAIALRGVDFAYADGPTVLNGVDLTVPAGSWLGVIGTTGSGKSTLIDLMLGLLQPTRGTVSVDGAPLSRAASEWWPRVAIIPQTVHLFDTSIRDNITLGLGPVDESRLAAAVEDAALAPMLAEMPQGLASPAGEGGRRLSGGQRQRVALARALYRDPAVLVLDEGTSALDHETEREVFDGLRRRRESLTLVVVGHRASSVRNCDRIVVLEAGAVHCDGTYDDLATSSPLFQSLLS